LISFSSGSSSSLSSSSSTSYCSCSSAMILSYLSGFMAATSLHNCIISISKTIEYLEFENKFNLNKHLNNFFKDKICLNNY
jgi:hypothetical protein